jgi:hypothetical protein
MFAKIDFMIFVQCALDWLKNSAEILPSLRPGPPIIFSFKINNFYFGDLNFDRFFPKDRCYGPPGPKAIAALGLKSKQFLV